MLKVMFFEQVISFENSFNGVLYLLSQIPLVGRLINEDSYERNVPKKIISYARFLFGILLNFLGKGLYCAAFLILPYLAMNNLIADNRFLYDDTIVNIFIIMSCLCGSLISTGILTETDEDYMLINVMRVDPKKHYRGRLFYKLATDFVFFLILLCMLGIAFPVCLRLALLLLAARGIGEFVRLLMYDKLRFIYNNRTLPDVILILLCVYFAYVSPCRSGVIPHTAAMVLETNLLAAICLVGILCLCAVWFYGKYDVLARNQARYQDVVHTELIMRQARIREAKTKVTICKDIGRYEKKRGYAYLNAIFFDRSKRKLHRGVFGKAYALFAVAAAVLVWLFTGGETRAEFLWKMFGSLSTWLVFVMFLLSCGADICRVIYYNCDRMLMELRYFRQKDAVMKLYLDRVARIIWIDMKTALFFCIAAGMVILKLGHIASYQVWLPVFGEIVVLSMLFSIYHTMIYHLLQPYNAGLKIKVPLFSLCNAVLLIVSLGINLFPIAMVPLMIGTICVTILLFAGSILLIKKYGGIYFKNH